MLEERQFPETYVDLLLNIDETKSNIQIENDLSVFPSENADLFAKSNTVIIPIKGGVHVLERLY